MKRTSQRLSTIWAALLLLLPFHLFPFQQLPTDPDVLIGKLDNGFTYYLRSNPKPENRIEFRLAVKAGSIVEDDDQLGLAHFTEHMLFNGTKNFEKNELVDFLQKMGLEFGGDLNAYTSFDETVYMLPIPSDKPENVKNAMLVLSDWAHQATFDNEEIDKERGVVMEEWRLRLGAYERMRQQIWPITLAGSRYAERLPIGEPEILENFEYDAAKRFYRDWYRPDLMALIAVGDFDVAEMEQMIKEYFSDIKMPEKPRERIYYTMPDFEGTRVAIASDDEATSNSITINFIQPGEKETGNTFADLRESLVYSFFSQMMNQRLRELVQSENPPFQYSYSGYGSALGKGKNDYTISIQVKEDKFTEGLLAAIRENERVRRFGFTQGELDRTLASFANSLDRFEKEADKRESWSLVQGYLNHFLNGGPLLSAKQTREMAEQIIPTITLKEINGLLDSWWHNDNRTIEVQAKTENAAAIPSAEEMTALLDAIVEDDSIEPYEEEAIASALMDAPPKPGKIVAEQTNETTGITHITLSNGAEVFIKPTDFKNDEVRMTAFSFGGTSLYPDNVYWSASNAAAIVNEMGIGDFSAIDLGKFLTGKTASVQPYINSYEEGLSGFSSVKDLETFFQLLHLRFTNVRMDESAFNSWLSRTKNLYVNFSASPDLQYSVQRQRFMYDNHPRVEFPSAESFDKIELDKAVQIYKERFANGGDFKFVFVGNVDMPSFRKYLETYVASLPAKGSKEMYKDLGLRIISGKHEKNIYVGVDDKSQVNITFSGDFDYNLENNGLLNAAASILSNKMIETLREEMGGVYGAGASFSSSQYPNSTFSFSISFPCKPENVDKLVQAAIQELENIKQGNFTQEDLDKVINARKQNFEEQIKQNSYWQSMIATYLKTGEDMENILTGNERADAITKEAIVAALNKFVKEDNMIKTVKLPQNQKAELQQEIKKN
ncbi:M16 family metallopeptidase [Roseivirga thermotolerans]|uniref:Zinc protease n=1 Tax=Roseivirga thermotolerans TaxID=1758176 RepID=A0ABQ3I452_9BACT|nr:insulinase family protein [Roseivirga thermotolerans]GHE54302.1 zinc protease [Roseivirga thermotolerans]